jgi:tetratricopeptide (TPR) repeat protein
MQTLTLFVSSPGDVRDERQVVGRVVERIQARYWNFVRIEPVLWEKEPLRATAHFNEELVRPSDCDLFLCVLWSRLGSPLPSQFNRADGTRFDSGTEWELVEATEAFEKRHAEGTLKPRPDILVYRKTTASENADPEQVRKLETFCRSFFFNDDGTIRRAFSPYSTVAEFASLLETHLEKMILRHIQMQRGLIEEAIRPLPVEGSPFKGLGTFDFEDASLFFGRNRAIAESLERWKSNHAAGHAFLLIYGGSGYGKSSLMRAGLAPRLIAPGYIPEVGAWRRVLMIPVQGGSGCIDGLARALFAAVPEIANSSEPLDLLDLARGMGTSEDLALTVEAVVKGLDSTDLHAPVHLLLMIDQLEEIFTSSSVEPADREQFFNALAALAMCGRIWVVATMRSEFFPRIPENRNLYQLVRHNGGYILSPPGLSELHQIIRYPALAAGLEFERDAETGRDLSEVIYQDAVSAPDALPLLEFTLEELYQRREENVLTWKSYQDLGSLSGAIARRAQEIFETLDVDSRQEAARRVFGELVTLDGDQQGPATRRRARRDLLEKAHPGAPGFLKAFVAAQLLVTSSEDGSPMVTLAHEALATHWPVLRDWIGDHRDLLQARARLEAATRLWMENGRSRKLLLAEGRLSEGQRVRESGIFQLNEAEHDLVKISTARARRKLRMFQTATVVFAILALAAGALGVVAKQRQIKADRAEQLTRLSLAEADFDAGAARAEDQKPDEALPFLMESLKSDPQNFEAQALLLSTLRQTSWHFPVGEISHPQPVTQLGFGNDSNTLFTGTDFGNRGDAFNTVLRWDLATRKMSAHLAPGDNELQTLCISPDAAHVIIRRGYKRPDATLLCDARSMRVLRSLPGTTDLPASCFAWSRDGKWLAVPHVGNPPKYPKTWRIIEVETGQVLRESNIWTNEIDEPLAAQFDGRCLRAVHADGGVFEMDVRKEVPAKWSRLDDGIPVNTALFSPDGRELLVERSKRDDHEEGNLFLYRIEEQDGKSRYTSANANLSDSWLQPQSFRQTHPWTYWYSPVWQRLMAANKPGDPVKMQGGQLPLIAPLVVNGPRLEMVDADEGVVIPVAPFVGDAAIKSLAFQERHMAVGTASGNVFLSEFIKPTGYPMKSGKSRTAEESEEWQSMKTLAHNVSWQRKYGELALRNTHGESVSLQQHPDWQMVADCSLREAGDIAVLAGYGSSSGGYVSPGLLAVDAKTGQVISELEPLEAPKAVEFLSDGIRLAAIGSDEVALMELRGNAFNRQGTIPVAGAMALHPFDLPQLADCMALASVDQVKIYQLSDLSLISTMPLPKNYREEEEIEGGMDPRATAWAVDPARGWLALRLHQRLNVWQIKSGRTLLSNVRVPDGSDAIRFGEENGMLGVFVEGDVREFVPLAKTKGVTPGELAALSAWSKGLAGVSFGGNSRAITRLDRATRIECLKETDRQRQILSTFLRGAVLSLPDFNRDASIISPLAWRRFWQRLLLGELPDYENIARNTESFRDEPWRQAMIRGLIGKQDSRLFDSISPDPDSSSNSLYDPYINSFKDSYHRLAGDPVELQNAKNAAWKVKFTTPETAGVALLAEEWEEDWKKIDAKAVGALEPRALEQFKEAIRDYPQNDERRTVLAWVSEREQSVGILVDYLGRQRDVYQKNPTTESAYTLAEALMLAGNREEAEALVATLEESGQTPSLAAAHFLIASDLSGKAPNSVNRALDKHQSSWLWRQWLLSETTRGVALEELASRILAAAPEANAATTLLLRIAMEKKDVAVLNLLLDKAANLPPTIGSFMRAMMDWNAGNKSAVFAMWPEGIPDAFELSEREDWQGWEQSLDFEVTSELAEEIEKETAVLACPENATAEEALNTAATLLNPESETLFGKTRIAGAIPACHERLTLWQGTAETMKKLLKRARETGVGAFARTRMEAQLRSFEGDDSAASILWKQVVDEEDANSKDYLSSAFVLLRKKQTLDAYRVLHRGLRRFAGDASYQNDAAWMLIQSSLPAEALDLLDTEPPNLADDVLQMRLLLTICAADQSGQTRRADTVFKRCVALFPAVAEEEAIRNAKLPEILTEALVAVAKRNK